MRLFTALHLSDALREHLVRARTRFVVSARTETIDPHAALRPVAGEKLHLTLVFLGEVSTEHVSKIEDAFDHACTDKTVGPVPLVTTSIGAFPSPNRPRVIWAGVEDRERRIAAVEERLRSSFNKIGSLRLDSRPFHPHITLAYLRSNSDRHARRAVAHALQRFVPMEPLRDTAAPNGSYATRIALVESKPGPEGTRYVDRLAYDIA